jgi:peptidoglycan/LPS O-acetylase OafA/YrhL
MKNNRTYTHYYGLDFLRGISGYGVAVCHYFAFIYQNSFSEYLSFIFVEFFFILSGFVLFPQLLKVLENKNNLLIFYQRRWIRTLPLYFVCLLLISFIFNKVFTLDFYKYFFFIQDIIPNFLNDAYYPIVWSLSIEEFFYLIFPLILILLKDNKDNNILIKLLFLFVLLISIKFFFIEKFNSQFIRTGTLFRFDAILLGFMLRFVYKKFSFFASLLLLSFFLCLYLYFKDYILLNNEEQFVKFIFILLLQLLSTSALIFFINIEFLISFNFMKKIALLISRQTYSVYLIHMIFIYILMKLNMTSISSFCLYVTLLFTTSSISYYFLEKPLLAMRPKFK